jgi:SAM-dependent methyltransferase
MKNFLKEKTSFIPDRKVLFASLCKGKEVLYIGCGPPEAPWFLEEIKEASRVAKEFVGLDIKRRIVEKLRALGYNVFYGDAEKINLGRKFDVIMGMPLTEISNQGIFFENMKGHLKDNGILVVSTPNISCLKYIYWQLIGNFRKCKICKCCGNCLQISANHTLWHSEDTLRGIAERHGWRVKETYYSFIKPRPPWEKNFLSIVSHFISPRFIGTNRITVLEKNLE